MTADDPFPADGPGVAAVGAYAPRGRLPTDEIADAWDTVRAAGVDAVAVPAADEDPVTMALAAARRALGAGGRTGSALSSLSLAATTPPLEEEDLTARLGAMLDVPGEATRRSFGASTRAGTAALRATLAAGDVPALVVAADAPRGDPAEAIGQAAGAGAAAFLVTSDGPGRVHEWAEFAAPYPGTRFRERGDDCTRGLGITEYDRTAFRETLRGAVDGLDDAEFEAAAVQAPDGALPYRVAGALGATDEQVYAGTTVHELGDTGAASVPLGIARAIAGGRRRILAAAHGSGGGADAFVLDADGVAVDLSPGVPHPEMAGDDGDGPGESGTDEADAEGRGDGGADVRDDAGNDPVRTLTYPQALRRREEITPDPPAGGGAYVSVPSWRRSLPQRYRLEAGRCPECRALAFPPEGACPDCNSLVAFDAVELPGTGTVEAVTTIGHGGAPPEFAPQQARGGAYGVAVVAFDGPDTDGDTAPADHGSVSAPVQVAGDHPVPTVGDRVAATIRRIYTQEGVTRYGTKVRPLDGPDED